MNSTVTIAKDHQNNKLNPEASEGFTWFVRGLVFFFPITVATSPLGSYIYLLLVLPALYFGRGWSRFSLWERRLMLGYVVAFAVMALSLINTEELREGGKELERYLRIAMIVPIYLMFRRFGFSMGRELAAGAVVACFVMGAQAFYQVEWQGLRAAIGYYHKIIFGDLAVLWVAVVAVLVVSVVKSWFVRSSITAAILCALYASIMSGTRGAWLFTPVIPVILLWMQWKVLGSSRLWIASGLVVLMVVSLGVVLKSERVKGGIDRGIQDLKIFAEKPKTGRSWGARLNLWRNSLIVLSEKPLLGSGLGDFQSDMKHMVDEGRSWSPHVVQYGHAHSIYFDALAKGGLLGFLATVTAYLLLPFIVFVRATRQATEPWERFYAIGGVLLIAAFATFGLSEGLWSRNAFVNTYVICLVVFLAGVMNNREQITPQVEKT